MSARHTSQSDASRSLGFGGSHAGADVLARRLLDVVGNFVIEFLVDVAASE
jgi:hypothetical protein